MSFRRRCTSDRVVVVLVLVSLRASLKFNCFPVRSKAEMPTESITNYDHPFVVRDQDAVVAVVSLDSTNFRNPKRSERVLSPCKWRQFSHSLDNISLVVLMFGTLTASSIRRQCSHSSGQKYKRRVQAAAIIRSTTRNKSSAVAVADDADDDMVVPSRPRLAALRQKLQQEQSDVSTSTAKVHVTQHRHPAFDDPSVQQHQHSNLLTDRFSRRHTYLRISLTERCNLRCTYCMPAAGVPLQPPAHLLQTTEILELARYFASHGVHKFRLTGGEPTLRRDLVDIVAGIRDLAPPEEPPFSIGMTTNGVALNARKLQQLVDAGLSSLNISLDTLDPDKFASLTRRPYYSKVRQTLDAALAFSPQQLRVKLNCVVQRGVNEDEVPAMVRLLHTHPTLQVRFIEYMPFADNQWRYDQCVPYQELLQHPELVGLLRPVPSDDPHDTTKWYTTIQKDAGPSEQQQQQQRQVGFITSMSEHFCGTCNRIRLSADGQLQVCLFGRHQVNLRDALRQGEALDPLVYQAIQGKHAMLGGHPNPVQLGKASGQHRPMTLIGG